MRNLRYVIAQRHPSFEVTAGACVFLMRNPPGPSLRIIATTHGGWDHVSVSLPQRCPTWEELERVKRAFFEDHETAMQLHVPPADHINNSEFCLHLWRPRLLPIPRPPGEMVGIKGKGPAEIRAMGLGVFHDDAAEAIDGR